VPVLGRSFNGIIQSRHSRRLVPITRSQKAFACGDRGGVTHGRDGSIDAVGIDAVVIVDQESMRRVARNQHSELLRRPIRRGMFGHIPVPDPAGADSNTTKTNARSRSRVCPGEVLPVGWTQRHTTPRLERATPHPEGTIVTCRMLFNRIRSSQ
jgi:hypothetical protein